MDGWKTSFLLGCGLVSGAFTVSFRECHSNEIHRSLKNPKCFHPWRSSCSQLRSWWGSGWCHGWHRSKSPKIYTQVGTLHRYRSNMSHVSSHLIPGFMVSPNAQHASILLDFWVSHKFLDFSACGSMIFAQFQSRQETRKPPTRKVYRKWKSSAVPGILQCRKRPSTIEVGVSRSGEKR